MLTHFEMGGAGHYNSLESLSMEVASTLLVYENVS